eukprot:12922600-Prorocentrum_lima.AAC.1
MLLRRPRARLSPRWPCPSRCLRSCRVLPVFRDLRRRGRFLWTAMILSFAWVSAPQRRPAAPMLSGTCSQ